MIYTIYPWPTSFFPLDSFCPGIILPHVPEKLFNDLHYLPMWPTLFFPWIHFAPYHFALVSFCPLERNCLMIYTIYPCPISFCPLDWTLGIGLLCFNRMLGQMLRCYFIFILIKKPFSRKVYDRRASSDWHVWFLLIQCIIYPDFKFNDAFIYRVVSIKIIDNLTSFEEKQKNFRDEHSDKIATMHDILERSCAIFGLQVLLMLPTGKWTTCTPRLGLYFSRLLPWAVCLLQVRVTHVWNCYFECVGIVVQNVIKDVVFTLFVV